MRGTCFSCQKTDVPWVPRVWHGNDVERICAACFALDQPGARILSFDAERGGLHAKWVAEQFGECVMHVPQRKVLHVLQPQLDAHNRNLMLRVKPPLSESALRRALEEYRTTDAIYQMDAHSFAEQMGLFYELMEK